MNLPQRAQRLVALRRASGPLLLVVLWWLATATGWTDAHTLPSPTQVARAGQWAVREGRLQAALWASLQRVVIGASIGVAVGTSIAVVAGLWRWGDGLLDSTMQVVKAVPVVALVPLLISWLGLDESIKLTLVAIAAGLPVYTNVYGALRHLDVRLLDVARTLHLTRTEVVRHIALPAVLPEFLVGLRTSVTTSWLILVVAEELNAPEGLGRLLSDARSWVRLDIVVLVVVVYAVLGLLSYAGVRWLERVLLPWHPGRGGR